MLLNVYNKHTFVYHHSSTTIRLPPRLGNVVVHFLLPNSSRKSIPFKAALHGWRLSVISVMALAILAAGLNVNRLCIPSFHHSNQHCGLSIILSFVAGFSTLTPGM